MPVLVIHGRSDGIIPFRHGVPGPQPSTHFKTMPQDIYNRDSALPNLSDREVTVHIEKTIRAAHTAFKKL